MTWTKQTKSEVGTSAGFGTQAFGTSQFGGGSGVTWRKKTKATTSWTKKAKAS